MYTLAHAANLIDGTQRARRHGVGRAGDKRNIGSDGKQFTRRTIARVERKGPLANQARIKRHARGAQASLKTATAVITGRAVPLGNSNIGNLAVNATRKRMAQLKGGLVIVVIDARRALNILADQHDGHAARLNRPAMLVCNHSCHQHNAINRMVLEQIEVFELAIGRVVGVCKQHLVATATEHLANAGGNAAHGFRVDLRHDDADELGGTGAQRASLAGPHVSGQLNRLLNALGLVRRYVATVEVARDGGARNAGQLGHIFHLYHEYPCH